MNHAITQLEIAADIAEHNLPLSEQAGAAEQAELQHEVARDCRAAIEQLRSEGQGSEQEH